MIVSGWLLKKKKEDKKNFLVRWYGSRQVPLCSGGAALSSSSRPDLQSSFCHVAACPEVSGRSRTTKLQLVCSLLLC